jgi:hypothetical protein
MERCKKERGSRLESEREKGKKRKKEDDEDQTAIIRSEKKGSRHNQKPKT